MSISARSATGLALVAIFASAGATPPPARPTAPRPIDVPAPPGSRVPDLEALPDGRLVLSWIQPSGGDSPVFRCAVFDGSRWSAPVTIASGESMLVNSADSPGVRALGGNRIAAHWRVKRGANGDDVRIAQSNDLGRTWSAPVTPHRDGTATEHGFVSLVPAPRGMRAVWLDGRNTVGHEEGEADMALRTAVVGADGSLSEEGILDARVCDCCPTAAVVTGGEIVVAYRDRDAGEVRDIAIVRRAGDRWSPPRPLHADGWRIAGCPVNGPALAASGSRVAAAWFAAARDTPRVFVAFSSDRGASFGRAIQVDEGNPTGHVHVAWIGDDTAVVTWLEASARDVRLCARGVRASGARGATVTVGSGASSRDFPRVVPSGGRVVVAWTEAGEPPRIRVAALAP